MTLPAKLDWDLLRIFNTLLRSTSIRQAACQLGISHPTVRRRLASLEEHLGFRLFERNTDSLQATPEALALMEKVEAVEVSVKAFERSASNADHNMKGTIRISAPDIIMSDLLAPDIVAFTKKWPQITLNIETTYELADLSNREADIAIRIVPFDTLPQDELAGRKATSLFTAVYGEGDHWIGWDDHEQQMEVIKDTPFADRPIHGVLNNIYLQIAACKEGMGLAYLPCFMGDTCLKRRTPPKAVADLWILIHPDLRRNPRLLLFRDEMFKALQRLRPKIEGAATPADD